VNWSRLYINKLRKNDFNPIINGQEVAMLRDTGCTKTLVHSSLVPIFPAIPWRVQEENIQLFLSNRLYGKWCPKDTGG
jgi:hypothetical protein